MDKTSNRKPRRFKLKDPEALREAEKYSQPIPSRSLILHVIQSIGTPLMRKELAIELGIRETEDLEALRRRLRAMERDGQLLKNRKNCYCLINSKDLISGRVIGHADGFGFLKPDDGSNDLFLSPKQMRTLMHGDRTVVRIKGIDRRGRREAAVVEVLERNTQQIVGKLYYESGIAYVVPDKKQIAHDILIPNSELAGAKHDQIVIAEIVAQPSRRTQPIGKIIEVLGSHMAPGMEIEVAIRAHDLPCTWPATVSDEIDGYDETVSEQEKIGRVDYRDIPLVTIDGEDARDFDDAVFCERKPKGWRVLVAIADVSHYVVPTSALDKEANKRGTSVYFPERVIPMLPEKLSNGLCSLNPDVDRLCIVCEIYLNDKGKIYRSSFVEGVMRSHARLTYNEVAGIVVAKKKSLLKKYHLLVPHLDNLYSLYQLLRAHRETRGAIDFETPESRIVFGSERKIEQIVPVIRNDAHRLIEELMISANIAAAKFLNRKKIAHLLRTHKGPTPDKLNDLKTFLSELGLSLEAKDEPESSDYMSLLNQIEGRADAHLIQTVLLRSLSQAVYSPDKTGHFGLALDAYTHFTSPIRRYPDLLTHRAIRHCIQGNSLASFRYTDSDMVLLGEHCSTTERRADEATRDVMGWLKCEFMQDKLGEEFSGIITSVTSFGFFVELNDIFIEGLVHISSLGQDYFHFDPIRHRLDGERSGVSYRLGDSVRVAIARIDLDDRKIDLELILPKRSGQQRSNR